MYQEQLFGYEQVAKADCEYPIDKKLLLCGETCEAAVFLRHRKLLRRAGFFLINDGNILKITETYFVIFL